MISIARTRTSWIFLALFFLMPALTVGATHHRRSRSRSGPLRRTRHARHHYRPARRSRYMLATRGGCYSDGGPTGEPYGPFAPKEDVITSVVVTRHLPATNRQMPVEVVAPPIIPAASGASVVVATSAGATVVSASAPLPASDGPGNCPPQDIVAQACDENSTQVGDPANLPQSELAGRRNGAIAVLVSTLRNFRNLFHPKSFETDVSPDDVNLRELLSMNLDIPVEGVTREDLQDSFLHRRGRHGRREHLAIDIGAPRGTPVVAATDGTIVRARRERVGGNAIYLEDTSGKYLFYYCHLSRFTLGLHGGETVRRGDVIGYVGATGDAHGAHLHFAVTRLPDDSFDFRRGLAVNPYLIFLFGQKP